jgi:O-antigen biosynthesis protein WbqP
MNTTANEKLWGVRERESDAYKRYPLTVRQILYTPFKRLIDIILSLLMLCLLSPICLVTAVLIKGENLGPILFCQDRIGKGGKVFRICKFRTMSPRMPKDADAVVYRDGDQYITKLGAFLRKASIDEIPQFLNVLKGEMSVIGPRPLIMGESEVHAIRLEEGVYTIKPGLTGLAQVNGRDLVTPREKAAYDTEYLHRFGPVLDLKIIFRSIMVVISRQGVFEGHTPPIQARIVNAQETNVSYQEEEQIAVFEE